MIYTDDPVADAERHYNEQEAKKDKFPKCDYCGMHMLDYYYEIDNEYLCEGCLNEHYKKSVEYY